MSHFLIFCACSAGNNSFNLVMNNIVLIEMIPRFKCSLTGSADVFSCVEADFCGKPDVNFWVDRSDPFSIYNWAEQVGLICRPGWQVGLIGSVYFGGWCSTLLWMPQMSEWIGRKRMFFWSLILYTILYAIVLLTTSFNILVASFFLLGFFQGAKSGVGWPYFMELLPKNRRAFHTACNGILGGSYGIIGSIYFVFISKNAYYFMLIGFIMQVMSTVLTYFMPESPVQMFMQGRIEEGRQAVEQIAKMNGKQLDFNYSDFREYEGRASELSHESQNDMLRKGAKSSPIQQRIQPHEGPKASHYWQQRWIKVNMIVLVLIWVTCTVNYQLISFTLKYLPGSIYVNNTFNCISEILGNIFSGYITPRTTP